MSRNCLPRYNKSDIPGNAALSDQCNVSQAQARARSLRMRRCEDVGGILKSQTRR